jgi:hypothetical protein
MFDNIFAPIFEYFEPVFAKGETRELAYLAESLFDLLVI